MPTPAPIADRRRRARLAVLVVDFMLLLFPPLYWIFDSGPASFWYFIVANTLVTLSLFVLWALRDADAAPAGGSR